MAHQPILDRLRRSFLEGKTKPLAYRKAQLQNLLRLHEEGEDEVREPYNNISNFFLIKISFDFSFSRLWSQTLISLKWRLWVLKSIIIEMLFVDVSTTWKSGWRYELIIHWKSSTKKNIHLQKFVFRMSMLRRTCWLCWIPLTFTENHSVLLLFWEPGTTP